jgi:hypothetical protein
MPCVLYAEHLTQNVHFARKLSAEQKRYLEYVLQVNGIDVAATYFPPPSFMRGSTRFELINANLSESKLIRSHPSIPIPSASFDSCFIFVVA